MGLPVVTVASGGLPVVESTIGGTPVTEAANGRGVAVTKVIGRPGMPVVYTAAGATSREVAGSTMLAGGMFPVVVTGSTGVHQGNIGGIQVEE